MTSFSANSRGSESDARRDSSRASISLKCEVRLGSQNWRWATLKDLSPSGFCVEGLLNPAMGQSLSIRIPGMQMLGAFVRWQSGVTAGCEFASPLHVAVFDHLVRQAQAI